MDKIHKPSVVNGVLSYIISLNFVIAFVLILLYQVQIVENCLLHRQTLGNCKEMLESFSSSKFCHTCRKECSGNIKQRLKQHSGNPFVSLILKCNRQLEHSSVPSELHTQHHVILAITVELVERRLGCTATIVNINFRATRITSVNRIECMALLAPARVTSTTRRRMPWHDPEIPLTMASTCINYRADQQNALASNFVHSCAIT